MCFVTSYKSDSVVNKTKSSFKFIAVRSSLWHWWASSIICLMNSVTDCSETILSPPPKVTASGIWGLNFMQESTLRGHRTDCRYPCSIQLFVKAKAAGRGNNDLYLKKHHFLISAGFILGRGKETNLSGSVLNCERKGSKSTGLQSFALNNLIFSLYNHFKMDLWGDAHTEIPSLFQALSTGALLPTVWQHRQHAAWSGTDTFWTLGSNSGLRSSVIYKHPITGWKSRCPRGKKNCCLSAPFDR